MIGPVSRVLYGACAPWRSFLWDARHRAPLASYPEPARATPQVPYLDLLQAGFSQPPCHHGAGALLPHLFTLTGLRRRYGFCATFRRITPPSCYEAPCPTEPGLSSTRRSAPRPPGPVIHGHYTTRVRCKDGALPACIGKPAVSKCPPMPNGGSNAWQPEDGRGNNAGSGNIRGHHGHRRHARVH